MKRVCAYANNKGHVVCHLSDGRDILLPIVPGILKHPRTSELGALLRDERVAKKYTKLALQRAAWPILSQFPVAWLQECLEAATVRPGRERALRFLLADAPKGDAVSRRAQPSGLRPSTSA